MANSMTESEMAEHVRSFLEGGRDENGTPFLADELEEEDYGATQAKLRTFRDAGLLTGNAGVVISLPDGSEFQVTVVRSKG